MSSLAKKVESLEKAFGTSLIYATKNIVKLSLIFKL